MCLTHLDKQCREVAVANETHKKCIKSQCDKTAQPIVFVDGGLVLVYDQDHDKLSESNLNHFGMVLTS